MYPSINTIKEMMYSHIVVEKRTRARKISYSLDHMPYRISDIHWTIAISIHLSHFPLVFLTCSYIQQASKVARLYRSTLLGDWQEYTGIQMASKEVALFNFPSGFWQLFLFTLLRIMEFWHTTTICCAHLYLAVHLVITILWISLVKRNDHSDRNLVIWWQGTAF